jgi:4-amino-4-deoxy-L-arabinose transferase-like glycosyltransferase
MPSIRAAFDRATLAFFGVLLVLTAARIFSLQLNPFGLYFDEAQYWTWSRAFDWGYFTKPPLIAWVIGATTAVFGDAEWAVRLGAPLAHAIAGTSIVLLGRHMYGAAAGAWAGIGYLTLPGIFFSSFIISTDALLLPLWSIALLATWRLMTTRAGAWAVVLGLAVGLGVLAKYAMLYFVLCTAMAAWLLPPMREALKGGRAIIASVIAIAVVTPNIIWNVNNGFATARHTIDNGRFGAADLFNLDELSEFVFGQASVLGPVMFILLFVIGWVAWRRSSGLTDQDKFLISYILPPFLFVSAIAFISRANVNWVAVAYPAAVVWFTGSMLSAAKGKRWVWASFLVNSAIGLVAAYVLTAMPETATRFKGVRTAIAWEETAELIAERARPQPGEAPFTAILVDDRTAYFELAYYWREERRAGEPLPPVRMWLLYGEAHNSAEASDPMRPEEGGRVLVVHMRPDYIPYIAGDFTVFRSVEHVSVPLGGGRTRELEFSVGEGFAPAPRDEVFEQRLRDLRD